MFGRLYQWLQFPKSAKKPGSINDVLREQIFKRFDLPGSKSVLGKKLPERRLYTVNSLPRETGPHYTRLGNLLVAANVISAKKHLSGELVRFDAQNEEEVAAMAKPAVNVIDLPELLNCSRTQADQLGQAETLKTIDGHAVRTVGRIGRTIDEFLKGLETDAVVVKTAPPNMEPLAEINGFMRANMAKVVNLILEKKLTHLAKLEGISGLPFHPEEI